MGEHTLVKEIEEHMEVHTPFIREWHDLEKSIDQPAFAPTGFAIQVQALRYPALCLGRGQQQLGTPSQTIDYLALTGAEPVAKTYSFGIEVLNHFTSWPMGLGQGGRAVGQPKPGAIEWQSDPSALLREQFG